MKIEKYACNLCKKELGIVSSSVDSWGNLSFKADTKKHGTIRIKYEHLCEVCALSILELLNPSTKEHHDKTNCQTKTK